MIHSETESSDALGAGCLIETRYFGIVKYWFFSKFPLMVFSG